MNKPKILRVALIVSTATVAWLITEKCFPMIFGWGIILINVVSVIVIDIKIKEYENNL